MSIWIDLPRVSWRTFWSSRKLSNILKLATPDSGSMSHWLSNLALLTVFIFIHKHQHGASIEVEDDEVETKKQIRIKESIVVTLKAIFWSNTYWFLFQKSDLTNSCSCCQRQLDNSKVQKRFSMAAESSWCTVTRVNSADRGTSSSIVTVICLDNEANDTAILWGCIWSVKMLQHCYEHGLECFFSILNIYLYMQYNIFNYIKIKYMNILNIKD